MRQHLGPIAAIIVAAGAFAGWQYKDVLLAKFDAPPGADVVPEQATAASTNEMMVDDGAGGAMPTAAPVDAPAPVATPAPAPTATSGGAVEVTPMAAADEEATVRMIRGWFQETESARGLRKRTVDLEGLSTEGGEGTVFERDGQVVKISTDQYMESGRHRTDYYLRDGRLYFAFDRSDGLFGPTEDRWYFDGRRLVRWISRGNKREAITSAEAKRGAATIMQAVSEIAERAGAPLATP